VYDQCSPGNALDYEDADSFMIPQNSPNVRLTTMTYPRYGARGQGASRTGDKRSALLGDPEGDQNASQQPSPRNQSDPYFKLVPSSSSVGGSVPQQQYQPQGQAGGDVSPLARSVPRRPPPPTAANIQQPGEAPAGSAKQPARLPVVGGGNKTIDWREEIKRFYIAIGMPEKIAGISTILATWAGKEEEMLLSLMEKYRTSIPTQMTVHLEQLIAHLETHTDSSFLKGPPVSSNASAALSPSLPKSPQRKPPPSTTRGKPSPARANL
jgi:hypothetical protein